MVQRDCNLTIVGGLLDSKGYGIATPMGELSFVQVTQFMGKNVIQKLIVSFSPSLNSLIECLKISFLNYISPCSIVCAFSRCIIHRSSFFLLLLTFQAHLGGIKYR